jgi:hypothetical protein
MREFFAAHCRSVTSGCHALSRGPAARPAKLIRQGGLGIGLTLVRRLVELHSGTVSVQSEGAGKGTRFIVRLPAVEPSMPEFTAAPKTTRLRAPLSILLIEDNEDARESLAWILTLEGHTPCSRRPRALPRKAGMRLAASPAVRVSYRTSHGRTGFRRNRYDRICEDLCEHLMDIADIDSSDVSVTVREGCVVLEGTVPVRSMKYEIEDIAATTPGVVDVENHIRVPRRESL